MDMRMERKALGISAATLAVQTAIIAAAYFLGLTHDSQRLLIAIIFVGSLVSVLYATMRMTPGAATMWGIGVAIVICIFVFLVAKGSASRLPILFVVAAGLVTCVESCSATDLKTESGRKESFWLFFTILALPQFCIVIGAAAVTLNRIFFSS